MNSVEINGSFYGLQRPSSWARWFDETPDDFVFAVKGPRYLTHIRRLQDSDAPLANFFASGVLGLRHKLGPLLWQLPPSLDFDPAVVEPFLATLPRDTDHAAWLAGQHGDAVREAWLASQPVRPLRHALEVRHPGFVCADAVALLRQYRVALVVADTAGRFPQTADVTADFVYIRLHGATELYRSGYDETLINRWATRIDHWRHGDQAGDMRLIAEPASRATVRDVYCYFDNTDKRQAPGDAITMARKLEVAAPTTAEDHSRRGEPVTAPLVHQD